MSGYTSRFSDPKRMSSTSYQLSSASSWLLSTALCLYHLLFSRVFTSQILIMSNANVAVDKYKLQLVGSLTLIGSLVADHLKRSADSCGFELTGGNFAWHFSPSPDCESVLFPSPWDPDVSFSRWPSNSHRSSWRVELHTSMIGGPSSQPLPLEHL